MEYNDVKKSYDSARHEQLNVDKSIRKLQTELDAIEKKYKDIDSDYEAKIAADRANSLEKYKESSIRPIEEKLNSTRKRLEQTQEEYDKARSEISYEKLLSECSSRQDILDEVREASAVLKEHLSGVVGERLFREICAQAESQKITIDETSLPRIIAYFNKSEDTIEKLGSGGLTVERAIDSVEKAITENKTVSMVISAVVLLGIVVFPWKVFACYVLLLTIYGIYNVQRNRKIYKIFKIQKAVQDNIDGIDALLKKQIEEEVENQKAELDDEYLPKIESLEEKVKALEGDLVDTAAVASSSFVYDNSKMMNLKQSEIDSLDKQKSTLLIQKKQQEDVLQEKTKIVADLAEQLNEMLSGLKKKYLSGVGTEVIFEPHFLFDIDTAKNKPVFYLHPQTSCLYLYESIIDVYDFIRLISVQLRAKLNPFNLSISVLDIVNAGNSLLYFTADNGKVNVKPLFQILITEDDMKERLDLYQLSLMKRQENIIREFGDIRVYNCKMVEMSSLAESYDFLFCIDPSPSIYRNPTMIRMMKIGGALGIFVHLFISKTDFANTKDGSAVIFDNVGKVCYLENGACRERAKDFVKDDLFESNSE